MRFLCYITTLLLGLFNYNIINAQDFSKTEHIDPWKISFQEPATEIMHKIMHMHNSLMILFAIIVIGIGAIIIYIAIRFNAKRNPIPSKCKHNTIAEITWITIPLIIVLCIAGPSIKLLSFEEQTPKYDMTLKVVGYQWYWGYTYPDYNNISFDSNINYNYDPEKGEKRLLAVDNKVYLPVNTNIRILLTAADVIHSWAVPALGLKKDTVPGRLNEMWVNIEKPGTYYGQCSELCGAYHGFMPIVIEALSKEDFKKWIEVDAKAKFA